MQHAVIFLQRQRTVPESTTATQTRQDFLLPLQITTGIALHAATSAAACMTSAHTTTKLVLVSTMGETLQQSWVLLK